MSDYTTAIDSTGLDVHGQKALRDLPAAVRQLVDAMAAKGWNWGVYTYPYQDRPRGTTGQRLSLRLILN